MDVADRDVFKKSKIFEKSFVAPQAYFQTTKDTIAQKVSNIILHFSMLSRGLGRLRALTLATPDFFWDLAVLQKKIKKCLVGVPGRVGTSGVPDLLRHLTVLGPKSTQEVKIESWIWLFLEGSTVLLTTSRECGVCLRRH